MIRPAPGFEREIARAGFSKTELARTTGLALSGIQAMINPAQQPGRRGGVRGTTAWTIARAVAAKTGETEETAYNRLFVEVDEVGTDGRRIELTPA